MAILRTLLLVLLLVPTFARAAIEAQAGPYRITLTTQPKVVPVGQAKVVFKIADSSGQPLENLNVTAIAHMPGMFMGEREQRANPIPGEAGRYAMQAAFSMAGAYEVTLKISGAKGASTVVIPIRTGQDTGQESAGGFALLSLLPWIVALALLVFVIYRMRKTDQKMNARAFFSRGTIGGLLLLGVMLFIAFYAVNKLRRPGSMTPLEAQVMEMNTPAPPGATAVQLATVQRGPLAETVRYSGQAVGFVEQDVNPRVTGTIVWMPLYVGDRVKKGQVLARLDTSQIDPQVAERAAMMDMAVQGVGVASTEYQTAIQEVAEARAELAVKRGMVEEAEAMLEAARQERLAMEAEAAAMQTDVASAEAEVSGAEENAKFMAEELRRSKELFAKGAVSRSELQQSESENADAQAKLRQARSMVQQAQAKVNAAKANVRKAGAMVAAAQKKIGQAQADVRSSHASIRARESAAQSAKGNISKERAGVAQARAGYQGATTQKGYSALKAEVDGVVTQRLISPGVVVNPGQTVLRIAQISPIRLQANVPTADLERIQVGAEVSVTGVDSGNPIRTRISSISPSVDPQSRTGVVEVLWPNSNGKMLPGQFVTMQIGVGGSGTALFIPVEALQRPAGAKPFVWLAESGQDSGRFMVKRIEVQTGRTDGKNIEILNSLAAGQQVVTVGAAHLKEGGEVSAPVAEVDAKRPTVEVTVSGFKPDSLTVEQGQPVTITFIRRTDETCGTEVVFPDLKITKPLPLNKPVEVTLIPEESGEIGFTCGMNMLKGKVIVR